MMNAGESLDRRYLEFTARTTEVFGRYPQLEPLRYFIFRDLLIQPRACGFQEYAKRWVRPLVRRQRTVGLGQKAEILIWIEGERGIIRDTLLPVARELTRRGERVQLVSFNGPGDLPDATVTCRCPAVRRAPAWAKQAWNALCQAEQKVGKPALERSFLYACANNQSLLNELNHVLDAIEPRIVVTASTQLMGGSAIVVAAKNRRIRTALLQHGLLQPFYVPLLADLMCTWGPLSSETLARLGVETRRLMALGSPRHDTMFSSGNGTARQALLRCLALENKLNLVFFSNGNDLQRNGSAPLECAKWIETIAREYHTRLNVIVRLHPNEDGSLYRHCRHLVVTKDNPDFEALLDGCDCVVSLCSTALYEALLYRKPIWQLAAPEWPDLAENWKQGVAQRVKSQDELRERVECLLDRREPSGQYNGLVAGVFNNHGRATQKVAEFLTSQIHQMPMPDDTAAQLSTAREVGRRGSAG